MKVHKMRLPSYVLQKNCHDLSILLASEVRNYWYMSLEFNICKSIFVHSKYIDTVTYYITDSVSWLFCAMASML